MFGLLTISIYYRSFEKTRDNFPMSRDQAEPYLPLGLLLFAIFVRQKTRERVNADEAYGMFRVYGYFDTVTNLSKGLGNLDINHTSRTKACPGRAFVYCNRIYLEKDIYICRKEHLKVS